jgi:hypothetical protein
LGWYSFLIVHGHSRAHPQFARWPPPFKSLSTLAPCGQVFFFSLVALISMLPCFYPIPSCRCTYWKDASIMYLIISGRLWIEYCRLISRWEMCISTILLILMSSWSYVIQRMVLQIASMWILNATANSMHASFQCLAGLWMIWELQTILSWT